MSVLFQNAAGQLVADPAGFLRLNWGAQPRSTADVQAFLAAAAHHLVELGYDRMLANQLNMVPFSTEEQQWVSHHWLPAAVQQSGYRFGAIVVSDNVMTRLATSAITANVQDLPLRYRSFDAEEQAIKWLVQQTV
ncbi:MAG: hypothetical protein ACRYFX_16275 [Janthinobacterium lividum]